MLVTTLLVVSFILGANAHSTPKTPEQVKAYHDLQQAAYHCAPAVAAYTAERQRSFAQKVLGGAGGSLVEGDLFEDGKFEDESSSKRKLLACNPVDETTIRNHTCVLGELFYPINSLVINDLIVPLFSARGHTRAILCDRGSPNTL